MTNWRYVNFKSKGAEREEKEADLLSKDQNNYERQVTRLFLQLTNGLCKFYGGRNCLQF